MNRAKTSSRRTVRGGGAFNPWKLASAMACGVWLVAIAARAHETDQYSVPVGREFADLRLYFSESVHEALSAAVGKLNVRIDAVVRRGGGAAALDRLYSPDAVAWAVLLEIQPVVNYIEVLELKLRSPSVQQRYPGLVVAHLPAVWIYHHPALLLDPTKLIRLGRCSTIMIDGVYLGTDKLAHFFHMGYLYFSSYRGARSSGLGEDESVRRAVRMGVDSENGLLGMLSTGVRSNADLASNYLGFLFFRNLTEDVRLRGRARPPMLVRDGPHWRLNDHVHPNADFFAAFISRHWDEALNPSTYGPGIGQWVRQELRRRCPDLLRWYRDEEGRPLDRVGYLRIMDELSTYEGFDYGHQGDSAEMVTIASTCFDEPNVVLTSGDESEAMGVASRRFARPLDAPDAFGRGSLWRAADKGDVCAVEAELAAGADANAPDADGERPLHVAARWGHAAAEALIAHGAEVNARTHFGFSPLHLAVREMRVETVRLLLARGADANARDAFGCTPLHDAASRGFGAIAELLHAAGADPDARDVFGAAPLHPAARQGHADMVEMLLGWGADPTAKNARGATPADLARAFAHENIERKLTREAKNTR